MLLSLSLTALFVAQPAQPAPKPFEFQDGDRIVWLGNTLVEREQRSGYWETALIAANHDKNITLRNLGWSGDTVFGEARGRFDYNNAAICFKQLVDQALALKPTVIFVSYGTNESFEGKEGLPKFEKGLEKLLDALEPAKARIVLFSPPPAMEAPGYPDQIKQNRNLELYAGAIQKIAEKRKLYFAPLQETMARALAYCTLQAADKLGPQLSELMINPLHLTELGYEATAPAFLGSLGVRTPQVRWDKAGREAAEKLTPLRNAIIAKNELFFYRWRPQNETYLFGFRKHEQGKNAKEVAEFDPLVAKEEDEIAKIRKSVK